MARALPIALACLVFFFNVAKAEAPPHPFLKVDIKTYALNEALQAHVSPDLVRRVIGCESNWDAAAKGDFRANKPTSFGLVQIHLPAHPDITKEQALDPYFSIDYLVKKLSQGEGEQWTCYRMVAE